MELLRKNETEEMSIYRPPMALLVYDMYYIVRSRDRLLFSKFHDGFEWDFVKRSACDAVFMCACECVLRRWCAYELFEGHGSDRQSLCGFGGMQVTVVDQGPESERDM